MRQHRIQRNKGVALFIALVVAGLLLSIGLAVSFIAFKELSLSNTIRQSQIAFYTSEAGLDCARFWIFEGAPYFDGTSAAIRCGGATRAVSGNGGVTTPYWFEFGVSGSSGSVRVEARRVGATLGRSFDVSSRGYNLAIANTTDKKVERYQQYTVTGLKRADFMLVMDISGSVCRDIGNLNPDDGGLCADDGAPAVPPALSEYALMRNAARAFIDNLNIQNDGTGVKLGMVTFWWDGTLEQTLSGVRSTLNAAHNAIFNKYATAYLSGTNIEEGIRKARLELTGLQIDQNVDGTPDSDKRYTNSPPTVPYHDHKWHERPSNVTHYTQTFTHGDGTVADSVATLQSREQVDPQYPDFIVVISDGAPNVFTKKPGTPCPTPANEPMYSYQYGCDSPQLVTDTQGATANLYTEARIAAEEAQRARNAGITIFVVGVGVGFTDPNNDPGDIETSDYLKRYIASNPLNYVEAENFAELEQVLRDLALGVIPIVIQ